MVSIGAIINSKYHTKQINPLTNSPASHVIIYSCLSVCLSREDGAIERPPKHQQTSDKPQKQATAKAARAIFGTNTYLQLPELLVNVYSYQVMVKGVSCCCMCGRLLLSNPVIFIVRQIHITIYSQTCKPIPRKPSMSGCKVLIISYYRL